LIPRIGLALQLAVGLLAAGVVCRAQQPAPPEGGQPAPVTQPQPPTQPSGEKTPSQPPPDEEGAPKEGSAAASPGTPTEPKLGEDEYGIVADEIWYEKGAVYARGHVQIRHQDMVLSADAAEVDENQEWAQLYDNVLLTAPNQRTTADRIRVNLDTGEWHLTEGKTELAPSYFSEGKLKEPVYVGGKALRSVPRLNLVEVEGGGVTTCDLPEPHYDITADRIDIHPGKDITLDHPSVYLFGERILRYPGVIRLSLRNRQSKLIPEIGQNEVEGFYAKFAYPYDAGRHADGVIRLNVTTKRGVGLGVDHTYDTGKSAGEVSLFYEPSMSAYSALVRDREQFSRTFSSTFNVSLQNNSGYGLGATTSFASDLTLRADSANAHTTLGFQDALTSGGGFSSQRFSNNLMHQQRGPFGIDWTLRSLAQVNDYGTSPAADEELQLSLDLHRAHPAFDWDLSYQERFDLDGNRYTGDSYYYTVDELPSLVVRSDSKRLGLGFPNVPIDVRVELGQFHQQPEDVTISRAALVGEIDGQPIKLAKGHEMLSGLSFRQSFYSEGSAQYDIRASADLQSRWGGPWYSQLSWNWELPQGFSPLSTDYAARQDYLDFDFSHYIPNRSRVELNGGYDVEMDTWRDLVLRAEYTPNTHNRIELQTAYDPNFSQWRPVEARWQFVRLHRLDLTLSTSYDVERSVLGQVVLDSDWVMSHKWRLETLTGYNGATNGLDFLEARITRDLHCWIGSLSYSLSQNEIRFNIGLKAFPFEEWEYGVGGQGQLLTPSFGQYY